MELLSNENKVLLYLNTSAPCQLITSAALHFICLQSCPTLHIDGLLLFSLTLCKLSNCGPPGSYVHGIFQALILERVAIPSPGDLSNPGIEPDSPALAGGFFTTEPPGKCSIWWVFYRKFRPCSGNNGKTLLLLHQLEALYPTVCSLCDRAPVPLNRLSDIRRTAGQGSQVKELSRGREENPKMRQHPVPDTGLPFGALSRDSAEQVGPSSRPLLRESKLGQWQGACS